MQFLVTLGAIKSCLAFATTIRRRFGTECDSASLLLLSLHNMYNNFICYLLLK